MGSKSCYKCQPGNYSDLENNTSELSSVNLDEIENLNKKIDNLNKEVKKYKIDIDKLNTEIQNSISSDQFQEIKIEKSILKNEMSNIDYLLKTFCYVKHTNAT